MTWNQATADESDPLTSAGDRSAILAAFKAAFYETGGVETLTEWASANRAQFYALLFRVLPPPDPAANRGAPWGEGILSDEPLLTEAEWEQVKSQANGSA